MRWLASDARAASGRAAGLIGAGRLAAEQGDPEAEVLLEESVRLFRTSADERGLAKALHNLGWTLLVRGDSEQAAALQKESLSLFRKARDGWGAAETLSNLGIVAEHEDDAERAKMLYEESLVVRRELGDKRGIGVVLNNLGGLTLSPGRPRPGRVAARGGRDVEPGTGRQSIARGQPQHLGHRGDAT